MINTNKQNAQAVMSEKPRPTLDLGWALRNPRPELTKNDRHFLRTIAFELGRPSSDGARVGSFEFRTALSQLVDLMALGKHAVIESRRRCESLGIIVMTNEGNQAKCIPPTYRVELSAIVGGVLPQHSESDDDAIGVSPQHSETESGCYHDTRRGAVVALGGVLLQHSLESEELEEKDRQTEGPESVVLASQGGEPERVGVDDATPTPRSPISPQPHSKSSVAREGTEDASKLQKLPSPVQVVEARSSATETTSNSAFKANDEMERKVAALIASTPELAKECTPHLDYARAIICAAAGKLDVCEKLTRMATWMRANPGKLRADRIVSRIAEDASKLPDAHSVKQRQAITVVPVQPMRSEARRAADLRLLMAT